MPNHDHKNHRERVRSRLKAEGIDHFAPHEVLEYLLFCCIPQGDVNPLAHRLINRFGTVDAVLHASEEELCSVPGVGKYTAHFFGVLRDAMDEYCRQAHQRRKTLLRLGELIASCKSDPLPKRMHLRSLFLDSQGNLLEQVNLCWTVPFPHTRMLVSTALARNTFSALFLFERNDPMYDMDEVSWKEMRLILRVFASMEIRILDVYVLTPAKTVSLREKGLLNEAMEDISHYADVEDLVPPLPGPLNDE